MGVGGGARISWERRKDLKIALNTTKKETQLKYVLGSEDLNSIAKRIEYMIDVSPVHIFPVTETSKTSATFLQKIANRDW